MARIFFCPFCDAKFQKLISLKGHFTVKHSDNPYCFVCNMKFKSLNGLINHARAHRDEYHLILYYLTHYTYNRAQKSMIKLGKYLNNLISVEV